MRKNIVLGITGSIASYKACEIASALTKENFSVYVAMTAEALRFLTPLTFQHLTKNPVITDMFEAQEGFSPYHISLADKADLILVAPATANIIGKVASGICDDILSCTIISSTSPVLFAPAMNEKMYKNKIVQANIKRLKTLGYRFISPIKGKLACGYIGLGHIAEVDDIINAVKQILKRKAASKPR
ncbi:MAG: hypothetical protein FJZ16_09060 [Candidatus Omnitrophica bacterium]|nr:hypothetical protein [Candidatus Omnitrophota bacterium]